MTDQEIATMGLTCSLVFTVCCMTGGFLSDRFGRRLTSTQSGGLTATLPAGVKGRASAYLVPNILASTYADAVWTTPLAEGIDLRISISLSTRSAASRTAPTTSTYGTGHVRPLPATSSSCCASRPR